MFKEIIKHIYLCHYQDAEGSYLQLLSDFIEPSLEPGDIKSYQWLEAWMESTVDQAEMTDQGVYYFPMRKEVFYDMYGASLKQDIIERLAEYDIHDIGDALVLMEPGKNAELSDVEYGYAKKFYEIVTEEPDELLGFLLFAYCKKKGIPRNSIDTNLNGKYSVMAAAHNERISLFGAVTDLIDGQDVEPGRVATITSNWGACIPHLFCKNEIERLRAERELTRKVTLSL
jgi:hypothetical protein